ncbi:MAG TPA: energy transducer TonB [Candidatus Sulfotelmatobacter sp.]|nr:energy transducer TonB [Candidatus Sulfotelmatobacter sp.]
MKRTLAIFLTLVGLAGMALVPAQPVFAQSHADRKVIAKAAPAYPELAKRMRLQGAVKLEVVVRADGGVKSTRVIGGNPVLIQAAADAVAKWKFEVLPNESVEIVQLTFQP